MLAILVGLFMVPYVQAQTTSITVTQSPSQVMQQANGLTQPVSGTFEMSYDGLPSGHFLIIIILYEDTHDLVTGTITSSPDPCIPQTGLAGSSYAQSAFCVLVPGASSGSDSLSSTLTLNETGLVALGAVAAMATKQYGSLQFDQGSRSVTTFTVSVQSINAGLTIDVPSAINVTVDGTTQAPGNVNLSFPPGTAHSITVPQVVPITNQSQLVFDHWSDGSTQTTRSVILQGEVILTANYVTQYHLTLTDPAATGSGWYNAGSTAQISVPSSEPEPGVLGILGGTQTFQGWYSNGELLSTSASGTITMNGPYTLDTQWAPDNSMPIGIALLVLVAVAAAAYFTFRRRTTTEAPPQPLPQQQPPPQQSLPPVEVPRTVRQFCVNCGTSLPVGSKFCNKCGAQQP